jgi:hypothetical protein
VDDTFNEIRKIVVNKSSVGKNDISSTSFTKSTLNNIMSATERFRASMMSKSHDGIGMIKNITAHSRYAATPMSDFLIEPFIRPALLSPKLPLIYFTIIRIDSGIATKYHIFFIL